MVLFEYVKKKDRVFNRPYTQKCLMLTKIFSVLYLVFVLRVFQPWKSRFVYFWIICLKCLVVFPCFVYVTMYCAMYLLKIYPLFIHYKEFFFSSSSLKITTHWKVKKLFFLSIHVRPFWILQYYFHYNTM